MFPKWYFTTANEPPLYPFEGSPPKLGFQPFNPEFFRHLENGSPSSATGHRSRPDPVPSLRRAGDSRNDTRRTTAICVHRCPAVRVSQRLVVAGQRIRFHVGKTPEDWDRFARIVRRTIRTAPDFDSQLPGFLDYNKPWVTHCSIQRIDVYKISEATNEWREKWKKPIVIDECAYEGDIDQGWGNITGEEMVRRFWEGAVRGGYVGHGETYMHPEEILWWSKGGKLHGTSPDRIAFLRKIMEEGPAEGLNPLPIRLGFAVRRHRARVLSVLLRLQPAEIP